MSSYKFVRRLRACGLLGFTLVACFEAAIKTATRVKPVDHAPLSSNIYIIIAMNTA